MEGDRKPFGCDRWGSGNTADVLDILVLPNYNMYFERHYISIVSYIYVMVLITWDGEYDVCNIVMWSFFCYTVAK